MHQLLLVLICVFIFQSACSLYLNHLVLVFFPHRPCVSRYCHVYDSLVSLMNNIRFGLPAPTTLCACTLKSNSSVTSRFPEQLLSGGRNISPCVAVIHVSCICSSDTESLCVPVPLCHFCSFYTAPGRPCIIVWLTAHLAQDLILR